MTGDWSEGSVLRATPSSVELDGQLVTGSVRAGRLVQRIVEGLWDLQADAWALASARPAGIMGWNDRGRLETGARADLVIVEDATRRIAATFAGGQVAHLSGPLAARFL